MKVGRWNLKAVQVARTEILLAVIFILAATLSACGSKSGDGAGSSADAVRPPAGADASATSANQAAGVMPTSPLVGESCSLQSICGESKRSKDWDIQAANLDLMREELARLKIDLSKQKIAVVDSPVDEAAIKSFAGQVSYGKGTRTKDESGHGTFVAARIFSATPDVGIVSYGVANKDGAASAEALGAIIEKACTDGNKVINLSMGASILWGKLALNLHSELPKLGPYLVERGCILVQASGNENDDGKQFHRPEQSPFLQVGSIEATDEKSGFTNTAQIYTYGGFVAGLLPASSAIHAEVREIGASVCEGDTKLLPGTSFAAPIAAAVANAVYAVLQRSTTFLALEPAAQVGVVKDVLLRSSRERTELKVLDGLRAVVMADALVLATSGSPQSPKANSFPNGGSFQAIMARSARFKELTQVKTESCSNIATDCADISRCFSSKRKAHSLTTIDDERFKIGSDLFATAFNTGGFELARVWESDFRAQLSKNEMQTLSSLRFRSMTKRIAGLRTIADLGAFVTRLKPPLFARLEAGPFNTALMDKLKNEILFADRDVSVEAFRYGMAALKQSSGWLSIVDFAGALAKDSNEKLDDRALAVLIDWKTDRDVYSAGKIEFLRESLKHRKSGLNTVLAASKAIAQISLAGDASDLVDLVLVHKDVNDASLASLFSEGQKHGASEIWEAIWAKIQSHPKASQSTFNRGLEYLAVYVVNPVRRRSIALSVPERMKQIRFTNSVQAFYALRFALVQIVLSQTETDNSAAALAGVLKGWKIDEQNVAGARWELVGCIVKCQNIKDRTALLRVVSDSPLSYRKLRMNHLELSDLAYSKHLTNVEKITFLRGLSKSELPDLQGVGMMIMGAPEEVVDAIFAIYGVPLPKEVREYRAYKASEK